MARWFPPHRRGVCDGLSRLRAVCDGLSRLRAVCDGLGIIAFSCTVTGCAAWSLPEGVVGRPASGQPIIATRATPAAIDLPKIPSEPGLHVESIAAGGKRHTVNVLVPEHRDLKKTPAPLVINLHGHRGGFGITQIRAIAPVVFESLQPIVMVPENADGAWWQPEEAAFILGLVDAAKAQWPIDAHKIILMGYSNGGIGTWYFARLHPEHFSAAVPMAFNETVVGPTTVPIYALHGERDEFFPAIGVRKNVEALQAQGFRIKLEVLPRCEHVDFAPCNYERALRSAVDWIEREVWTTR